MDERLKVSFRSTSKYTGRSQCNFSSITEAGRKRDSSSRLWKAAEGRVNEVIRIFGPGRVFQGGAKSRSDTRRPREGSKRLPQHTFL